MRPDEGLNHQVTSHDRRKRAVMQQLDTFRAGVFRIQCDFQIPDIVFDIAAMRKEFTGNLFELNLGTGPQ